MFWCQITLTRWIKLLDNSHLMLMFSCVCSSNRFYEEIRDVRQLHNLSRSSSLRYTTPNAGCLVTTEVCHGAFCHTSYLSSTNLPPPHLSFTNYMVSTWYSGSLVKFWVPPTTSAWSRTARGVYRPVSFRVTTFLIVVEFCFFFILYDLGSYPGRGQKRPDRLCGPLRRQFNG